ncbi:cation:proton antiporter [Haematospirillum jordaniae]|uniref:Ferrous iron transporter n=1 Tax=Haematospirillum jordaniae TaxID=1549855 RepID=A0A143DAV3_9PROT|nr:cation:proton antiporter [Haematospirillum jordaniae]AMW33855.1 ferrous iron transporter [Haematospirillum jordaniae]
MEHHDFTGMAITALAAMACGVVFTRLRQPAIIGYILAGVILGPSALGMVTDRGGVALLAELGIVMLLFVIGLELSVHRFAEVWRVAVLTTLLQTGGSVGVMLLFHRLLDWSAGTAVLLGFCLALSSTAVVIKVLEQRGELDSPSGRLTVGILIAQDMAVVPMMLTLSALTGDGIDPKVMLRVAVSILILVALVWVLLRRDIRLPFVGTVSGHPDLGPLAAFGACFGAAALAGFAELSPGYGAFVAGLVIGNSADGQSLRHHAHPIQALLLMVFFLSIGLLLDLTFLRDNIGIVLLMLVAVTVIKATINVLALRLQKISWRRSFCVGVTLAQIGEFSFMLAGAGVSRRLLESGEGQLVVAVTVLSLTISPLWQIPVRRLNTCTESFSGPTDVLRVACAPEIHKARRYWDLVSRIVSRSRDA